MICFIFQSKMLSANITFELVSGYMTPVYTFDTGALVIGQVEAHVTLTEEAAWGVHTFLLTVITLQSTLIQI